MVYSRWCVRIVIEIRDIRGNLHVESRQSERSIPKDVLLYSLYSRGNMALFEYFNTYLSLKSIPSECFI